MLGYETIIRRKDRSGENELRGTGCERRSFIRSSVAGWNVVAALRLVIRRVLEGGEGVMRCGTEERSKERGVWVPAEAWVDGDVGIEEGEAGGE